MRALVILLGVLALAAGCGSGDDGAESSASGCEDVEAPDARDPEILEAPTEQLDPGTKYTLTFDTSCGSFTVTLDQELAPNTSASLVALAEAGFFDETIFHRVVTDFVAQGGDPTQTRAGGPGYSTVDPPPDDAAYVRGVVAMAKGELEPPGTAGSQFFVVTGPDIGLMPDFAIVGEVTSGLDTLDNINALGVPEGPPTQPIVISTVTVGES
jgi:peptidyl-prolyl cis-trans isomerase B (cyclophilin B)